MVIILTIFSLLCLFAGCLGVCAVFQLRSGMLTAFWIILLVCLFGFVGGAAVGLATPTLLASYGCTGQVYPAVFSINNIATAASQKLCIANNCTCYIDPNG